MFTHHSRQAQGRSAQAVAGGSLSTLPERRFATSPLRSPTIVLRETPSRC